uniref:Si:ch211-76l23.4 n=1 Tax=Gouania willdenowi TaxID=441366 RepID=A0A8C5G9B9_GOUWI
MASKPSVLLVLMLAVTTVTVVAQRRRPTSTSSEWNYRDGSEKVNMRNVANLTQVLDDWRFDILSQMRNLLQNEHQSVLPDYARISPLAEALDDLYKEFNALKAHLGDLTEKFTAIETFVDEVKAGRASAVGNNSPSAPRRAVKKKPPTSS